MTEQTLDKLAEVLADRLAPLVAEQVAEALAEHQAEPPAMLTAAEAARRLGLTREAVYRLADELGAVRLGSGPKPRLRFPTEALDRYLEGALPAEPKRNGRRRRTRSDVPLLPIRGERP